MHDLVIYGAGGLGREVAEIVRRINERHRFWNLLGFLDDGAEAGTLSGGLPVLGGRSVAEEFDGPLDVVLSIARPSDKRAIYEALKRCPHVRFPNVIDTDSKLSSRIAMEEGVVVSHFCSLSVDISLGRCVFINTGSHVGHDSVLGDFCSVMPNVNISGNVTIGAESTIGAGASILQGRSVGSGVMVGMGTIVLTDVPDACTVLGNPARKF